MTIDLILGDCLKFIKTLPDDSVKAIVTDPPYDFSQEERNIFQAEFRRICKTGAIIVFCPPENLWQEKCDQNCFWIKPISTKNTSKSYSRFVEQIQIWNGETWNADGHWSQYTNVFTDLVDGKWHPYQKPLSLMQRLIRNHTKPGDYILDPFAGSGTTCISAQTLGRNSRGCENEYITFENMKYRIDKEGLKYSEITL